MVYTGSPGICDPLRIIHFQSNIATFSLARSQQYTVSIKNTEIVRKFTLITDFDMKQSSRDHCNYFPMALPF